MMVFSPKKIIVILAGIFFLLGFSFASYSFVYAKKIYPHVTIANIDVGGLTKEEARKILTEQIDLVKNQDIELVYQDKISVLDPRDLGIEYQLEQSLETVFHFGRRGSWWQKVIERLAVLGRSKNFQVAFQFPKNSLDQLLNQLSEEINTPVREASLRIAENRVLITPSQIGQYVDKTTLRETILQVIGSLQSSRSINLPIKYIEPQLSSQGARAAQLEIENLLRQKIVLHSPQKDFTLEQKELLDWVELIAKTQTDDQQDYQLTVVFNEEKIKQYLDSLAKTIDQQSKDARLFIKEEKVTVFSPSQKGYQLERDLSLKLIVEQLYDLGQVAGIASDQPLEKNSLKRLVLPVQIEEPAVRENNIENLGIKELIGSATTSYKKSPANRKHNIKVGAEIFHGILIKPEEEFSFLKYLGTVSEEKGFRKELVIKQDRTEPEIGGGLCQVSTTMFRTALNTGLKITERTNHKYRVSYYEPPVGLDATIYDPSPDLKFLNDAPGYILIQTKVDEEKDQLTFEFYSTKDGRTVSISEPELYDWVKAPATQYIDDPEMNEGETKYLEKAHAGVKAKVNYQVKRGDKIINEQTFYSIYKAWGAVIKRGIKKVEQPAPAPQPTPTSQEAPSQPTPEQTTSPSASPEPTPSSSSAP